MVSRFSPQSVGGRFELIEFFIIEEHQMFNAE